MRIFFTFFVRIVRSWRLKSEAMEILKDDISYLLMPSSKRALKLNKAYRLVVKEQSYIYGRDVNIKPSNNVYKDSKHWVKGLFI